MAVIDLNLFDSNGSTLVPDNWKPDGKSGADKVAARVVYALLTPLGSVPGRPNDGTSFLNSVQNFRSEFDIYAAFAMVESEIAATVGDAEASTAPGSEKYGACRLANVSFTGGVLSLSILVAALDGSTPSSDVTFTVDV